MKIPVKIKGLKGFFEYLHISTLFTFIFYPTVVYEYLPKNFLSTYVCTFSYIFGKSNFHLKNILHTIPIYRTFLLDYLRYQYIFCPSMFLVWKKFFFLKCFRLLYTIIDERFWSVVLAYIIKQICLVHIRGTTTY